MLRVDDGLPYLATSLVVRLDSRRRLGSRLLPLGYGRLAVLGRDALTVELGTTRLASRYDEQHDDDDREQRSPHRLDRSSLEGLDCGLGSIRPRCGFLDREIVNESVLDDFALLLSQRFHDLGGQKLDADLVHEVSPIIDQIDHQRSRYRTHLCPPTLVNNLVASDAKQIRPEGRERVLTKFRELAQRCKERLVGDAFGIYRTLARGKTFYLRQVLRCDDSNRSRVVIGRALQKVSVIVVVVGERHRSACPSPETARGAPTLYRTLSEIARRRTSPSSEICLGTPYRRAATR